MDGIADRNRTSSWFSTTTAEEVAHESHKRQLQQLTQTQRLLVKQLVLHRECAVAQIPLKESLLADTGVAFSVVTLAIELWAVVLTIYHSEVVDFVLRSSWNG